MGWSELKVYFRGEMIQDLVGSGTRTKKFDRRYTVINYQELEEAVSLRVREDGKIVLNDMYGPYDPACSEITLNNGSWGWGMAVIKTGDSIEVFNFRTDQADR